MFARLTPELPKTTSAARSCSPMSPRASVWRRAISAAENLSHTGEDLLQPVRDERPVAVRDVVADVVSLLDEDERRVSRLVGDPSRLLPRDQAIEPAGHEEGGLLELADHGREVEVV